MTPKRTKPSAQQDDVSVLVDELFSQIQEAQGYAFVSDGETFPTVPEFFERIRGRLRWNELASDIFRKFLRKHGELRAPRRSK